MTLGIPFIAEIIRVSSRSSPLPDLLMQVSPIWASWKGLAANYALGPREYWLSIAITLALSLLMLLVAARAATRVWADRPQRIGQYGWRYKWRRLVRRTVTGPKSLCNSPPDIYSFLLLASRRP